MELVQKVKGEPSGQYFLTLVIAVSVLKGKTSLFYKIINLLSLNK